MRKTFLISVVVALTAPVVASAGVATPNPKSPAAQCRAERAVSGQINFKNSYGTNANKSNAFGKCVSKHARRQDANEANAARRCRAEQADPQFVANHGGKTFAQFYGTNRNGSNAFGKCVSSKADEATAQQQQARLNAARTCRAEQRQDAAAFKAKYGTNHNKSNAFGKCVSREARTSG